MMKAVYYDAFGPAQDVLTVGELPTPELGPGQVMVAVSASGVNPSDVKLRAGARPGGAAPQMPYPRIIPHSDGAGVIEAVGDGVDPLRVGERVWLWNAQWGRAFGSCAERIAIPADQAVTLPEAASFAEGACLGIPAVTAYHALYADGPIDGQTVLVTGAAGAVGRYATQMAKLGGARVIASTSGGVKETEARAAGADDHVDYRGEDVAERVMEMTGGRGVDRIIEVDFGANLAASTAIIRPRGVIAAYASMSNPTPALPFYQLMFKNTVLRMLVVYQLDAASRRRAEAALVDWLESGRLSHKIAACFPMEETAAAHDMVAGGAKIGAVVVEM